MELNKHLLFVIILGTLLSGCSLLNNEDNIIKINTLLKIENQFEPHEIWSVSVGNGTNNFYSNLHPTWQDGTVYAADRFGIVKALDEINGKQKWMINLSTYNGFFSKKTSALLSGGITASGKYIYIGSERAKVYALNRSDGTIAWKSQVTGEALSNPVVSDGLVMIHTSNGMLYGLHQNSGIVKWIVNLSIPALSLRGESSPTNILGKVIVGDDNGRVSAITIDDGQIIWQQRISKLNGANEIARLSDVDITPVIVNGIVYVVAYNGNIVALDLYSGQILWNHEIGSVKNFIVDTNRIYLVDQNDNVMALNTDDGITVWHQSALLHRKLTALVIYNNRYIVVGDSEGYVHWLNIVDGYFVARQKVDSSGFQSDPIVANDKLLIQAKNGNVHAIAR